MKRLSKSVAAISRVLWLIIGDNFTTPYSQVSKKYPYIHFGL